MNLIKSVSAMVLSLVLVGTALADHEGYDMQQGAISGGPGTIQQDQDFQQSNQQKQHMNNQKNQQDQQSSAEHRETDKDHADPVLPVPMH